MFKKGTTLFLALVLALALVPTAIVQAEQAPALEGPLTIRYIYHPLIEQMAANGIDYNENKILLAHEKNSGIALEFTAALADNTQEKQKIAMILASGQTPDLMVVDRADYFQYAMDGVFQETDGYLKDMPNYMGLVPDGSRDVCRIDGKLYGFPGAHEELEMKGGGGLLVRQDVLESLGIEPPTTLDGYYNMFKAVKEQKPDMIPLVGSGSDMFKAVFGVLSETKELDGKLVYTWAQPEMKEYLAYMNKLYAEGLYDKEFLTTKTTDYQEKWLTGKAFASNVGWSDPCVVVNGVFEKVPGAKLDFLPIPDGPAGPAQPTENFPVQRFNVIPMNAKNPELAARFIEYMCSPEAKAVQDYGIEGEDYQVDADGKVVQTLEEQNNVGWKICYEFIPTPESFHIRLVLKGFDWAFGSLLDAQKGTTPVQDAAVFMPPSDAYLKLYQQLALKSYADEQASRFITGERSLDEWDAYLGELEQRGYSRLETALNEWAASVK